MKKLRSLGCLRLDNIWSGEKPVVSIDDEENGESANPPFGSQSPVINLPQFQNRNHRVQKKSRRSILDDLFKRKRSQSISSKSSMSHNNNDEKLKRLPIQEFPYRAALLLEMPNADSEVQIEHGWNNNDRSLNLYIKPDDNLTFHRNPVAQSTDCIRGKIGYENGLHAWHIHWPSRQRGTHAVIGVATRDVQLHSQQYEPLVGMDSNSWGWDLVGNLSHNDSNRTKPIKYPQEKYFVHKFVAPDTVTVLLDMDAGTLGFVADGMYLGIAHNDLNLRGRKLFPIVSSVWGHCEVTMKYHGGLNSGPLSMKIMCRKAIRKSTRSDQISQLPLPSRLKGFLQYT